MHRRYPVLWSEERARATVVEATGNRDVPGFAARFAAEEPRLAVLVNNAGVLPAGDAPVGVVSPPWRQGSEGGTRPPSLLRTLRGPATERWR